MKHLHVGKIKRKEARKVHPGLTREPSFHSTAAPQVADASSVEAQQLA
jgi:hypothetical protein